MPPLEDLALLAATVGFLYWLSLRLVDDVLDQLERSPWVSAHEWLGRDDERPT